jgi:hypothetical protein
MFRHCNYDDRVTGDPVSTHDGIDEYGRFRLSLILLANPTMSEAPGNVDDTGASLNSGPSESFSVEADARLIGLDQGYYGREAPGAALREIAKLLNSGPSARFGVEAHARTLGLVEAWNKARSAPPNEYEEQMRAESPDGRFVPVPYLLKMNWPPGSPTLTEVEKNLHVRLGFSLAGAYTIVIYDPGERAWTPWDLAWYLFIRLITDPQLATFAGPCKRAKCRKYFVRTTKHDRVYCSHTCATRDCAIARTKEVREQMRKEKLSAANEAIAKWERLRGAGRTKKTWQEFTAAYNPAAEITPKFLTRAVNNGELRPPQNQEERSHERTK